VKAWKYGAVEAGCGRSNVEVRRYKPLIQRLLLPEIQLLSVIQLLPMIQLVPMPVPVIQLLHVPFYLIMLVEVTFVGEEGKEEEFRSSRPLEVRGRGKAVY
jgi:hypothetical protein